MFVLMSRQLTPVAFIAELINKEVSLSHAHQNSEITFFKNASPWGIGAGAFFRGFYDKATKSGVGAVADDLEGLEATY